MQSANEVKPTIADEGGRPPAPEAITELTSSDYKYGFVTTVDADTLPKGLNEETVRAISARKEEPQFMLEWRLKALRHFLTLTPPTWPNVTYPPIDFQDISYYSAPKTKKKLASLDEVDPEVLA